VKYIFVKLQISKLKLKYQFIIFRDHSQITINKNFQSNCTP